MLTSIDTRPRGRNLRKEKRLWNFADRFPRPLGCTTCPEQSICGGLQTESALFDCLGFCCGNSHECDAVCRGNPGEFALRVREVGGFSLENVPRAAALESPNVPPVIPLIYHSSKHRRAFCASSVVCLPLYSTICRSDGCERYANAQALAKAFGVAQETRIVLTGIADDPPIERWWSLGSKRRDAIRALLNMGVSMVTTPNFSLFTDQPRWDNMHNMKRIALVHEEFVSEGLPAALHVNARTERDWERWGEYVGARSEITHVSYEFGTGAGWGERTEWHAEQLAGLADTVKRPLHLVMRGGAKVRRFLEEAFAGLTVLDTSVFLKTMNRQRARLAPTGGVEWHSSPTEPDEMLDNLLDHNWRAVATTYEARSGESFSSLEVAG